MARPLVEPGQALERYQPPPPPAPVRLSNEELDFIVNSELMPRAYRGKKHDIFACVALGRQLGIGDMHALRSIYVVDGKATISAELMVALARQRGHSIVADYGEGRVTVTGARADNGDQMSVTWTISMAERAGLVSKDNWKKYPEAMLWARAVSQLCRMLFPDVLAGVSHTDDEAELTPEERVTEGIGRLAVPAGEGPDDSAGEPEGDAADSSADGPKSPSAAEPETIDGEGQQQTFEQLAADAGERPLADLFNDEVRALGLDGDADTDVREARDTLLAAMRELGAKDALPKVAEKVAAGDLTWLRRQTTIARKAVEKAKSEAA